jgi:hypothetical protein
LSFPLSTAPFSLHTAFLFQNPGSKSASFRLFSGVWNRYIVAHSFVIENIHI